MNTISTNQNHNISGSKPNESGSILVLTLISILVLSFMMIGLLTVGESEVFTTENYHLNRIAYYTAMRGVEDIRNDIFTNPSVESVTSIGKNLAETEIVDENGMSCSYFTGSLKELEDAYPGDDTSATDVTAPKLVAFKGFEPPPLKSISLGPVMSISPVVWEVNVTSLVKIEGQKRRTNSYSEILSGIYSILVTGYN